LRDRPTPSTYLIALSRSNSTSSSDRFLPSHYNIKRRDTAGLANSGSFAFSRFTVAAATSKLNPTPRQYSITANSTNLEQI
jgi:hypothetical protein